MFDNDLTAFDNGLTVNRQRNDSQNDNQLTVSVDVNAVGFSVKEMAEKLGMKRTTLIAKLKKSAVNDVFKAKGVALGIAKNAKIVYPIDVWKEVLESIGVTCPRLQSETEQSSSLVTVVEAEHVDPMDKYMQSALSFGNGAKPLSHRDTSIDVAQLQALAANATTAMSDFTNLLTEEEIQEAINRGSKRGAMKAALERQAETKTYEASMGGKPQGGEESPQSA